MIDSGRSLPHANSIAPEISRASARYHQGSVGVDYLLSKRTDVYSVLSYTHAAGQNGSGNAQAVIGATVIDAGKASQVRFNVGLRHRF